MDRDLAVENPAAGNGIFGCRDRRSNPPSCPAETEAETGANSKKPAIRGTAAGKIWAADFDLAAAGGAGHRRIAEMSLIEARLRSTLASGCDNAARPARRRLETSCGVHHRGDRSRTPMDSSTRPSMLSSPPPIPSDSDVDRRRASCSHSRNIASFSSRDS
jgi:hypothetical protein